MRKYGKWKSGRNENDKFKGENRLKKCLVWRLSFITCMNMNYLKAERKRSFFFAFLHLLAFPCPRFFFFIFSPFIFRLRCWFKWAVSEKLIGMGQWMSWRRLQTFFPSSFATFDGLRSFSSCSICCQFKVFLLVEEFTKFSNVGGKWFSKRWSSKCYILFFFFSYIYLCKQAELFKGKVGWENGGNKIIISSWCIEIHQGFVMTLERRQWRWWTFESKKKTFIFTIMLFALNSRVFLVLQIPDPLNNATLWTSVHILFHPSPLVHYWGRKLR